VHEGQKVTHPGLHRALLRGVRFLDEEGVFVVQIGHFRGEIDVEDVPFWVVAYDEASGEIELTDRSAEPLDASSLAPDPDGALRCQVKRRFPARFTHAAQAHLLDAVDTREAVPRIRAGSRLWPAPGLAPG
jgi:hypothetical protein